MLGIRFALLVMLTLLPLTAFGIPGPSVSLTANLELPVCREGESVVLDLALHNNGSQPFRYFSAFEESAFQITVTDEAGRSVPRTALGERVLTLPMSVEHNELESLAPGQTLPYRFNLAHLFDLSRAGTYTVSVRRVLNDQTTLTATSLKVHLVEAAAAYSGLTANTFSAGNVPFSILPMETTRVN